MHFIVNNWQRFLHPLLGLVFTYLAKSRVRPEILRFTIFVGLQGSLTSVIIYHFVGLSFWIMSECGRSLGIHITIHQVTVAHERTKEGIVKMFQVHLTAPIRGSYMAQCYSRWPDAALASTAMIFSLPDSPETSHQAQQCESGNDEQMSGLPKNEARKSLWQRTYFCGHESPEKSRRLEAELQECSFLQDLPQGPPQWRYPHH